MSTIDDINTQKASAVSILDNKIYDTIARKNQGAANLDDAIHSMMLNRQQIYLQALNAELDDPAMELALNAITTATNSMNTVAASMVTATNIINNVASLIGAGGKVVSALQGA